MNKLEELKQIYDDIDVLMKTKNLIGVKEYITVIYNEGDINKMRTVLVILKGLRENIELKDIMIKIVTKLELIIGHKLL